MSRHQTNHPANAKGRLLDAAYVLFANQGTNRVGIDTILAESGCAKASLYNNYRSKNDLVIAFLNKREQVWTREWLESEINRAARDPTDRLIAIFDLLGRWFHKRNFEGCSFINVMLETDVRSPVRRAATLQLSKIRAIMLNLAKEAGLSDAKHFAQIWHMLMNGAVIAACEGNRKSALEAKRAAKLVLAGWPRSKRAR